MAPPSVLQVLDDRATHLASEANGPVGGDLPFQLAVERQVALLRCDAEWRIGREAELIESIHEAIDEGARIVVNPAAYTFTSLAILFALKMFRGPIIELHISNIHRREAHYQRPFISQVATGVIVGLGAKGYPASVAAMLRILGHKSDGRLAGRQERKMDRIRPSS